MLYVNRLTGEQREFPAGLPFGGPENAEGVSLWTLVKVKTCELCQSTFQCTESRNCWCLGESVGRPILMVPGCKDCLCPECLRKELEKS